MTDQLCHRERSVAISSVSVIASAARQSRLSSQSTLGVPRAQRKVPSGYGDLVRFCHCERSAAISPFLSKHPWGVASAAQSALRVWRSRLFRVGKQKREIASCLAMTNKRHAMTDQLCHRERSAAISVVQGGQTQKREIASLARNDK